MKLSKLISTENLKSATITVLNPQTIVCDIFIKGNKKPLKKVFKSIEIDIEIPEISNYTVKHLGVKKYFFLQTESYYINLYYYN